MGNIVLLRHGVYDRSIIDDMIAPLTPQGERQSEQRVLSLQKRGRVRPGALIITSPIRRAVQGAEIFRRHIPTARVEAYDPFWVAFHGPTQEEYDAGTAFVLDKAADIRDVIVITSMNWVGEIAIRIARERNGCVPTNTFAGEMGGYLIVGRRVGRIKRLD